MPDRCAFACYFYKIIHKISQKIFNYFGKYRLNESVKERITLGASVKDKKICIIHPGNPEYDFRLKKTVIALSDAGADVYVLAYLSQSENDITDWPCTSLCIPRPYTQVKASENKIWLLRVLWNLSVVRLQSILERGMGVCEGLAKIAVNFDADLYYFINVNTLEELERLRSKSDKPIVYEAYEFFPSLLRSGICFETSKKNMQYLDLENKAVSIYANETIVVGDEIAEQYAERYKTVKPTVIYNVALNDAREESDSISETLKFYFQSYLRSTYNIENLLMAFGNTSGKASLTIQGDTLDLEYQARLSQLINSNKRREDVELLPACSYEAVVEEASQYDVGVISISANIAGRINQSIRYALQNKLFTYAAAGLALAAADYPSQHRVIDTYQAGRFFDPNSVEDMTQCFQELIDNREEVEKYKKNALLLSKEYSFKIQAGRLEAVCAKAMENDL